MGVDNRSQIQNSRNDGEPLRDVLDRVKVAHEKDPIYYGEVHFDLFSQRNADFLHLCFEIKVVGTDNFSGPTLPPSLQHLHRVQSYGSTPSPMVKQLKNKDQGKMYVKTKRCWPTTAKGKKSLIWKFFMLVLVVCVVGFLGQVLFPKSAFKLFHKSRPHTDSSFAEGGAGMSGSSPLAGSSQHAKQMMEMEKEKREREKSQANPNAHPWAIIINMISLFFHRIFVRMSLFRSVFQSIAQKHFLISKKCF